MKVVELSVNALIPYEFNNKIHTEESVNRVANSIREFGWTQPIVVDDNNVIVAGHGRYLAAKKLGLEKVPTYRVKDLTEGSSKHRYLMPLDDEIRKRIAPLARPYPKRAASVETARSPLQAKGGGAVPTAALHTEKVDAP